MMAGEGSNLARVPYAPRSHGRRVGPSPHQIRELAVVAAGFVVDAKIMKDLHQPLLLTRGLDRPPRAG